VAAGQDKILIGSKRGEKSRGEVLTIRRCALKLIGPDADMTEDFNTAAEREVEENAVPAFKSLNRLLYLAKQSAIWKVAHSE